MKYTEEKIASFQLENQRWQLIKMTNITKNTVKEIYNTVGGYIKEYINGEKIHIEDKEVKKEAEKYGLKKDNENYYYNEYIKKEIYHYQIRKNRKVISNIKCEQTSRTKFAKLIYDELNQLNLFR